MAGPETYKFYVEHPGAPEPTPWMDALSRAISVLLQGAKEHEWPEESYVRGFREGFVPAIREAHEADEGPD